MFWLKNFLFPVVPMLTVATNTPATRAALALIGGSGSFIPTLYHNVAPGIQRYIQPVSDYATKSIKGDPTMTVIMGHSLGGGVAELVGTDINKPSVSIEGPGVLEAQMGMLKRPWVESNGAFNTEAVGDIVPHLGTHSGETQSIDCQGFPQIPFAACHETIGSVFMQNCGYPPRPAGKRWQDLPMNPHTKQMDFCPNLPAQQEALPDSLQNSLVKTRSNYWWSEYAYLWNSSLWLLPKSTLEEQGAAWRAANPFPWTLSGSQEQDDDLTLINSPSPSPPPFPSPPLVTPDT